MRIHHVLNAVTALVAVVLAACGSARGDAEALCGIATEVAGDSSIPAERKAARVFERFDAERSPTEGTRNTLNAVAMSDPRHKLAVLQQGFREQGVDDWSCPALEQMLAPPP